MKRVLCLLLAVVVVFSGCSEPKTGDEDVPETTEEVVTVEETQTMMLEESTIVEMIEESDELELTEKIPLSNEAVLIIEYQSENSSKISIRFNDITEQEYLLYNYNSSNYKISPDLTKIAYINHSDESDCGKSNCGDLYIFDVIERKATLVKFVEYAKNEESKGMIWIDNENLLTIGLQSHYGWSKGGSVYYYNLANGSTKRIIPHDIDYFQIVNLEIDVDKLKLTILLNDGAFYNNTKNIDYISVQLIKIYELIENEETLTLNVQNINN